MISLDLMVPPSPVVPLALWGWLGYGFLFLLAVAAMAGAGLFASRHDGASLVVLGLAMLLAIPTVLRFFRAVAPGDTLHFWMLVGLLVLAAIVIGAVCARLDVGGAAAAVGAWTTSAMVAGGIDKWQEYMASVPMSWGLFLGFAVLGLLFVVSENA